MSVRAAVAHDPWAGWELNARAFNALGRLGIYEPERLATVSFDDLRRLRNVGSWTVRLIRDEMARHGLRLVGDTGRVGNARARRPVAMSGEGATWFASPEPAPSYCENDPRLQNPDFVSTGGDLPVMRGDFVYLLLAGDKPMYAGATRNLLARIGSHARDRKPFDRVLWQRTPPNARFSVESWLIRGLLPPWNGYSQHRRGDAARG